MNIENSVQLLVWLYRQTCASWWSLEPFITCFQEAGWDGLQRALHGGAGEIWQYSSRISEFSDRRRISIEQAAEEVRDLLWNAQWHEVEEGWQKSNEIVLSIYDPSFPESLRQLDDPPPVLWCSKEVPSSWWERCIAVVGSRRSSVYGEKVTRFFVDSLVQDFGMTIVSGCAVGIDSVAHQVCLRSGGVTVGILGVELSRAPLRVKRLFAHENAVLLSEWPPGFGGLDWNFARRNRLISGLSQGVLVAEAQEKSGTMLTVSAALEQGREVYVPPHSIWSKNVAGVVKLANNGARVVLSAADIVGDLPRYERAAQLYSTEEQILREILQQANGEMLLADLTLAKPATISSSQWWQALHSLTQKGEIKNTMGVISLQ